MRRAGCRKLATSKPFESLMQCVNIRAKMEAAIVVIGSAMADVCRVCRTLEQLLANSFHKNALLSTQCCFKDDVGTVGIDASSEKVYWGSYFPTEI